MSDFDDENLSEEDLRNLEDEHTGDESGDSGRGRPRRDRGEGRPLPSPLFRIKASHSNETYIACWEGPLPPELDACVKAAPCAFCPAASAAPETKTASAAAEAAPAATASPAAADGVQAPAEAAEEAVPAQSGATGTEMEGASVSGAAAPGTAPSAVLAADEKGPAACLQGGCPAVCPGQAPRVEVLAPTRYGRDICELQGLVRDPGKIGADEVVRIERIAAPDDLARAAANVEKEQKAFELCREKIEARKLPMKLVAAHYLLEEPKVVFFFSADSRVDFRELVKDLVSVFKMRIELRQIGVRDEARITGGCGVCGRVLCCHGVTDKLNPVSIKMAKDQNLSLNSMKISGPCGRLLCCLSYEYGFYRDARRELPSEGARFIYEDVQFRVLEVNALSGSVKVSGEDGRVLEMPAARFTRSEGRWQVRPDETGQEPDPESDKSIS